jgi:hypothetical protein
MQLFRIIKNACGAFESFFFAPSSPNMLALIRIATGAMLAYIHLVWLMDLKSFFGPDALINADVLELLHSGRWKWTYLNGNESLLLATFHEIAAMSCSVAMALGILTRFATPSAWFLTLMTTHRLTPMLFGLDQIVLMLGLALSLSRCGDAWSLDRKLGWITDPSDSWRNTVATRLIQIHLCVIYFFGGLGKARGWMWWDGSAMWFSAASFEYQSLDLTWIGRYPLLGSILTHATLLWELSYAALVWPKTTRPVVLFVAMLVHAGIALFLGMITFGTMMMVANLAFLPARFAERFDPSRTHGHQH